MESQKSSFNLFRILIEILVNMIAITLDGNLPCAQRA